MSKDEISKEIESKFGNQLRVRVNGILIQDEKLLMVKHLMGNGKILWSVPGGGMNFGQSASENLQREFLEETGLNVKITKYLFVHEYLDPPLHAMEHFFSVKSTGGCLKLGEDPELSREFQILKELTWMSLDDIKSVPKESIHQIFRQIKSLDDLGLWKGYFNFGNNSIK
ncbi:NUDIX domain-containing protein [Algoriphagus machipongonensis]|uniref:NUDIX hydrolase family protein n=1 Tax=Algoriphagus machipongonensis TaxID=388413 RepID=A3I082_9BACT|nr:NUDIX hydrolase [Algoriphagus machipongonensis]EAZ79878.1 NUDIX hydrolase family protein [Algoriphagus machipongonensis]